MKFTAKTRYRIYTENVHLAVMKIQTVVNWHFPSSTIIHADGVYNQVKEDSLIIEIITDGTDKSEERIGRICAEINKVHQQDCCLVTREAIECTTI